MSCDLFDDEDLWVFFLLSFVPFFYKYTHSPGGLFNGNDDATRVCSANDDDRDKTSTTNEEREMKSSRSSSNTEENSREEEATNQRWARIVTFVEKKRNLSRC
jgi:hypothetical protein